MTGQRNSQQERFSAEVRNQHSGCFFVGCSLLVHVESGARAAALSSKRADVVFWFQVRAGEEKQPDIPDGVILSASCYDWMKYLHTRKKAK